MDTARNYYQSAEDFLSVVRIACYNGQVQEVNGQQSIKSTTDAINSHFKASQVVDQSGDRAAAFHLALHLESLGDFNDAVHYFGTAGAYSNAIRLAKVANTQSEQ